MRITYTVPEQTEPKTGVVICQVTGRMWLVREDQPSAPKQPERAVYWPQVVSLKEEEQQ